MSKSLTNQPSMNGVILVDKPAGWTSHDVIAKLRNASGVRRIGHAGTLDPLATGLLVVLVGTATRLSDKLTAHAKTYRATVTFGAATDTDDSEGSVIASAKVDSFVFDIAFAAKVLSDLVKVHMQVPPQYSAIKVGGKTAHRSAREGVKVELAPREIEIYDARLISVDSQLQTWDIELSVSKGTYIRSIARDLGAELGCFGHISALRRVRTLDGNLDVADAFTLEELLDLSKKPGSLSHAFTRIENLGLKGRVVDALDEDTVSGRSLYAPKPTNKMSGSPCDDKIALAMSYDGRLLGLYKRDEAFDAVARNPDLQKFNPNVIFRGGIMQRNIGRSVVTLGVFDGVHKGHRELVKRVVSRAEELSVPSVVITFDPPPGTVVRSEHVPAPITGLCERIERLKSLGVDEVVIIPFTRDLADTGGHDFVDGHLFSRCTPTEIIVGENFRFGHGGRCGIKELAEYCKPYGTTVIASVLEESGAERISSTRIRTLLEKGDITAARDLLGHPYKLSGYVSKGEQFGRTIGVPTANVKPFVAPMVPCGGYRALVRFLDGSSRESAVFIGSPRDDCQKPTVEAHLFDFSGDLYNTYLEVELIEKVTDIARYPDKEALGVGIAQQVERIKKSHSTVRVE
ncbi:MAG: tRNA pseudouridine(55) synthase TruB [Coriobacteriia bacterium]|nr:tRNA pseudouridine(55) synthase TruB [Coriobacteriia bacterium]